MKIKGGFARRNSVTFVSENYIATAKREKEGPVKVETRKRFGGGRKPAGLLAKIPFCRGIFSLFAVLFQSKALAIVVAAALLYEFFPNGAEILGSAFWSGLDHLITLVLLAVIVFIFYDFGALKRYHGAEHKVANAFTGNNQISLEAARQATRVHERCGTNFLVILLVIAALIQFFINWDFDYSLLVGLAVAGEVARLKKNPVRRPLLWFGGVLQKYLFTAEPDDTELEVAISAIKALEEQEFKADGDFNPDLSG